jgi:hypothetical protein
MQAVIPSRAVFQAKRGISRSSTVECQPKTSAPSEFCVLVEEIAAALAAFSFFRNRINLVFGRPPKVVGYQILSW